VAIEFKKTNFVRNLAKKHKLVQHLDKAIAADEFPFEFKMEPKQSDDAWHPSGHCTPPVSELYDIATGNHRSEFNQGGGLNKAFAVGHFWHQWLQFIVVEKLGFASWDEVERRGSRGWGEPEYRHAHGHPIEWRPYHWATGSGDIAPCHIPNHGEYVVDFKTMSGQQYKQQNLPEWAAAKYEAQINIYMSFFDLEKGLIVGICKDSPHEFKEWEFGRNQDLIDAIYGKWEFVSELLDADEAPSELDDEAFDYLPITGPLA
jgi:hypothetical protein